MLGHDSSLCPVHVKALEFRWMCHIKNIARSNADPSASAGCAG